MCFSAGYFEFLGLKIICVIVIKIQRYETEAGCIYDYPVVSLQ
jgi:hypothetical protein